MIRTTLLKGFALVAFVVSITGCGLTPLQRSYNEFRSQEYSIPISGEESNSPSLILHVDHVKWGGREHPVGANYYEADGIRTSIKNFATHLRPVLSSIENVPQAAQYADFGLSFDMRVKADPAGAFLKGFFTLGFLPDSTPYTSHITLDAVRWDGRTTTISVKSDTIKVEYSIREAGSSNRAHRTSITQAYDNGMQKIAAQLIREGFFQ